MTEGIDHEFLNKLYKKLENPNISNRKEAEEQGYTVDDTVYPWVAWKDSEPVRNSRGLSKDKIEILTDNEAALVKMIDLMADKMNEASEVLNNQNQAVMNKDKSIFFLNQKIELQNRTIEVLKRKLKYRE